MQIIPDKEYEWDIFISHAHEDKPFVDQLADILISMGLKVWYDTFILEIGDSLTKKINKGLAQSKFGVVVLSKAFFKKNWTQLEVAALLNRETNNNKTILPIWHNITFDELNDVAPLLLDKLAANSNNYSLEQIAQKILKVVHPEKLESQIFKQIPEIKWPDGSTMVLLPLGPSENQAIAIGKYPITNSQYREFIYNINNSTTTRAIVEREVYKMFDFDYHLHSIIHQDEPKGKNFIDDLWQGPFYPWNDPNFNDQNKPVVCVSLHEALAYVIWVNMISRQSSNNSKTILPSAELWDFAAFGTRYPSNNPTHWMQTARIVHHKSQSPISVFNNGERINSRGVSDMCGNIWEWCSPIPKRRVVLRLVDLISPVINADLRGGGFLDDLDKVTPLLTTHSLLDGVETRHSDLGFRIAAIVNLKMLDTVTIELLRTFKNNSANIIRDYILH